MHTLSDNQRLDGREGSPMVTRQKTSYHKEIREREEEKALSLVRIVELDWVITSFFQSHLQVQSQSLSPEPESPDL